MDEVPRLADFLALADGHLRAAAFRPEVSQVLLSAMLTSQPAMPTIYWTRYTCPIKVE